MRTGYELPEHPRLSRLERLIINMTPQDWSDEQAEAFAMKHGPGIVADLNTAIREEQDQQRAAAVARANQQQQDAPSFGVMTRNN